jgi:ankyrin repeat protein
MRTYKSVEEVISDVQNVVEFINIPILTIDQKGIFGNTALAIASTWDNIQSVRLLVHAGARVNEIVEQGDTALHLASLCGNLETVRFLLDHGADPLIRNNWGETALDIASLRGFVDIVSVIRDKNLDES